jgi:hypothetical protein
MRTSPPDGKEEWSLPGLLDEFRTALREEIEAARQAASSAAMELISGLRIGQRGYDFQYVPGRATAESA